MIEDLYNRITGDEDAHICKDIPEAACNDQPRNFFAYLGANLSGKVADEIAKGRARQNGVQTVSPRVSRPRSGAISGTDPVAR